jgi:hypothetical protein
MSWVRFESRFSTKVPSEHYDRIENTIDQFNRKEPGIVKKVLFVVTVPVALVFAVIPEKAGGVVVNYEKSFELIKSFIVSFFP